MRIKPEKESAYYNIACLFALKEDVVQAIENLELWLKYNPNALKGKLDKDTDFNKIREKEAFKTFREKLKD